MATVVLTVIGDDRPGLVSALSAPIEARGGSWERSEMARLSGKFAGIILVTVADAQVASLEQDLTALASDDFHVVFERTDTPPERDDVRLRLHLLGADRPGIVAEISRALAQRGVGIDELATDIRHAPMAGGTLFEVEAILSAPRSYDIDELRGSLELIADELMVDIELSGE